MYIVNRSKVASNEIKIISSKRMDKAVHVNGTQKSSAVSESFSNVLYDGGQ